jgi:hypothetical protein
MPNRSTPNLIAAAILLPLAACTSIEAAEPVPPAANACLPATLDQFKGKTATKALGAQMLRLTAKSVLRLVKPGMVVTMDYSEVRLTVYLDAANRVERASCG